MLLRVDGKRGTKRKMLISTKERSCIYGLNVRNITKQIIKLSQMLGFFHLFAKQGITCITKRFMFYCRPDFDTGTP
jgi:hypothetical protein